MEGFSVIMPTYNQASFIRKAIQSLFNQTFNHWELIIINDGSTDNTEQYISEYISDKNIIYIKNLRNRGLGCAINQGLDIAKFKNIAYLPSDDFYYESHLEVLKKELDKSDDIILAYTKTQSEIKDSFSISLKEQVNGLFNGCCLQLVQAAHRKTDDRWVERSQYVTDDLFFLFWYKLIGKGIFTYINEETSSWTIHTDQHHKLLEGGGLNKFRQYYNISEPLKIRASKYKFIDEELLYKDFNKHKTAITVKTVKLKILLVGELSYHPERIYALEEYGCQLFGLWMKNPTYDFSTVGPIPFGNITDIPYEQWEDKIKEIQPDIIYAGLNYGAVPLAHEVLTKCKNIPFVWHFKEGPFICRQHGTWDALIELYNMADGKIFLSEESRNWYEHFIRLSGVTFLMDGDLPKINYFTNDFSDRLSKSEGEIHTVVPGRLLGVSASDVKELANHGIHLHLYSNYHKRDSFSKQAKRIAPNHFHIHPHCNLKDWVKEFSRYDAGWLHIFNSENRGDLMRAGWNDINLPARMSTLAAAGIPMIQKDNSAHVVAMQTCIRNDDLGVFYNDIEELASKLKDKNRMNTIRNNVLKKRDKFSFDYHVPELMNFFKKVIEFKKERYV